MFVVIFEVQPKTEQFEQYLELAKLLRPELEGIDGFLDNERYRSLTRPERILSLSSWRDEKALIRWRTHAVHHGVQEKGRFLVFLNYRLRVGEVSYDNASSDAPDRQLRFDETQVGPARAITLIESSSLSRLPAFEQALESEVFESIYTPGKHLQFVGWPEAQAAVKQRPATSDRYREVRVIRHYGMFDRRETPQFYPEVVPSEEALRW